MKQLFKWFAVAIAVICLLGSLSYWFLMDPYRGSLFRQSALIYPPQMEPSLDLTDTLTAEEAAEDLKQAHQWVRSRHPAWLLDKNTAESVDKAFQQENVPFFNYRV